jgi:hypothetical protein
MSAKSEGVQPARVLARRASTLSSPATKALQGSLHTARRYAVGNMQRAESLGVSLGMYIQAHYLHKYIRYRSPSGCALRACGDISD